MSHTRRRILFLICVALCAAQPAISESGARLRVLSYNIHHGEGMDKRIDLGRIAKVVKGAGPDVVMLQEVDRRTRRSGGVDQLAELARLNGMGMYFGKTIDHEGGEYGNAILSRLPVAEHSNTPLPGIEPRGFVSILTEDGVLFLGTHLDVGRSEAARVASAERINAWVAARLGSPAILAGDLNAVRGSATFQKLAAAWTIAGGEMPTIPVGKPERQIDFILFRPSGRWRVVEVNVVDEPVASDHRPIFAVLELLK
jgi:endonuclease/exonuclease/phosphatase family metal-dependent hydrolase